MAELGSDFGKILLDLKTASDKGWNTFTIVYQQWQSRLGDFAFKERSIDKIDVDFGAQQLVPSEELQKYVPLTVTGDGSCLFRALSVLVCSDETKSVEFRIRCVIELALNSTYYLADEQLITGIQAQDQLLGAEGSDSVDVGLIPEIFRAEVMKSCNVYEYATMWHMQAVGAVVKRKIKSVYLETTPEVTVVLIKQ